MDWCARHQMSMIYNLLKKWIAILKQKMPNVIRMYNRHLSRVDRVDENISQWCFPLLCYLLNVCVNSALLFAREGDYSDDMLAFTSSIVQCWLTKYGILAKNPGR